MSNKMNRRDLLGCAGGVVALACASGVVQAKEEEKKADLGSYCGIYCGSCPLYLMSKDEKDTAKIKCLGCKSDKKAAHCQDCAIAACAATKEIKSCGECKKFPCAKTKKFHGNGKDMALVAELQCYSLTGLEYDEWIKTQEARWTCPKCGAVVPKSAETCPKCNKDIYSLKEEALAYKRFRKGE